jgi:hypothetical protein
MIDGVEPGDVPLPFLWPDLHEPLVAAFCQRPQVIEVVGGGL